MSSETVSVLMATYHGSEPEHLWSALESMFNQTRCADQLVLVVDGPVSDEQNDIIDGFERDGRIPMTVLRLPYNRGLAFALNAGIEVCSGNWLMRMDSDDISSADRIETQLGYARKHPGIDVITSWCEEFFDDKETARLKSSPITHEAVMQALKWRNILCHPSMMVRATTLRRIQGYRTDFPYLEDYDLYVRLAQAGARFRVIPKTLLRFRCNTGMMVRRGGLRYCWNDIRFRTHCWRHGFLNWRQYVTSTTIYVCFRVVGPSVRSQLYRFVRI
jgi:glycosyltransferase involved in cell wall biosynthesis